MSPKRLPGRKESPSKQAVSRKPPRAVRLERARLIELRQRATIVDLLNGGVADRKIVEVLTHGVTMDPREMNDPDAERFPLSRGKVVAFMRQLREERCLELAGLVGYYKSEQVARLLSDVSRWRASGKNPMAVLKGEELLMRLLGTAEPARLQVDVHATVREAIVGVVMNMRPEELDAAAADQVAYELAVAANGNGGK